jgi:hypothetical protein
MAAQPGRISLAEVRQVHDAHTLDLVVVVAFYLDQPANQDQADPRETTLMRR